MCIVFYHSSYFICISYSPKVEAMEALIDHDANVNAQNHVGQMTPLHCAIRGTFQSFKQSHTRRLKCVELLLANGADGTICDQNGKNALDSVADAIDETQQRKMGDVTKEMGEMRKVLERGGLGPSALAQYIEDLNVEEVRELLDDADEKVGDVSQMEMNKSLLSVAERFKSLVDEENSGNTDDATYDSLQEISHYLIQAGANPNYERVANTTDLFKGAPLHIISSAICSSATAPLYVGITAEMAQDLLSHGATLASVTMALLPTAAHRGQLFAVKYLLGIGADVNTCHVRQGMTSLHLASRTGKTEIVKYLLEKDADMNITDDAGRKAIDYATANQKEDIVALLLEKESSSLSIS